MGLEGVGFRIPHSEGVLPTDRLSKLPQELRDRIFAYLNSADIQVTTRVSSFMCVSVITAANFNEVESIRNFISTLLVRLGETPKQRDALSKIREEVHDQKFTGLIQLKSYLLGVKEQLVEVLAGLNADQVAALCDIQLPHFMEDIFTTLIELTRMKEAACRADWRDRDSALMKVAKAFLEAGAINEAIECAKLTSGQSYYIKKIYADLIRARSFDKAMKSVDVLDSSLKNFALDGISQSLVEIGEYNRAVAVAIRIESPCRMMTFAQIAKTLIEADAIDSAVEFLNSNAYEKARDDAFRIFSGALAEANQFERALEIVELISRPKTKDERYERICECFIGAGELERALTVAGMISSLKLRGKLYDRLCGIFIDAGELERALTVAGMISSLKLRGECCEEICRRFIETGELERARAVAGLIPSRGLIHMINGMLRERITDPGELEKRRAINEWISYRDEVRERFTDPSELERAIEVAGLISDESARAYALEDMSAVLIKTGSFDRAIEVARLIPCEDTRGCVLKDISIALVQAGAAERAIEVAGLISDESARAYAFEDMSAVLIKTGSFDRAIEVARLITRPISRDNVVRNISRALEAAGRQNEIPGLISRMQHSGVKRPRE